MLIVVLMNMLTITGLCLMFWKTVTVIYVASMVGAINGVSILYFSMVGRIKLRLCWLMSCGLSLGYGLGSVNTIHSFLSKGVDPFVTFGLDDISVGFAMMLVMFSCALLLLAGCFEPSLLSSQLPVRTTWRVERFLWIAAGMISISFISGRVGYMGQANDEGGRVNFISDISLIMFSVGAPMSLIGYMQNCSRKKIRYGILFAFFVLAALPMGRRFFFYNLIVSVLMAVNFSGKKLVAWSYFKQAMVAGLIYTSVLTSNFYFMALRMSIDDKNNSTFVDAGPATFDLLLHHHQEVSERLSENVQSRTFVISYLAMLGHGGQVPPPMEGKDISLGVLMSIPDVFYKAVGENKAPVRAMGSEEAAFNAYFGVPLLDMSNSILTGGMIDFGVIGVFVYPILFCAGYRVVYYSLSHLVNEEGRIAVLIPLVSLMLLTEMEINYYVLYFRTMLIISIVWMVIYEMPDFFSVARNIYRRDEEKILEHKTSFALPL